MNKRIGVVVTLFLVLLVAGCSSQQQDSPNIATVNAEGITQAEFDRHYNLIKKNFEQQQGVTLDEINDQDLIERIKSSTYDDLILQKLVRQDAKKQHITVESQEIDSILTQFKEAKNNTEVDGYQQFLDGVQMDEEALRMQIETSLLYDYLQERVISGVVVTDDEAETYYNENQLMFKDPGGIQIYHILVETEPVAAEVMDKLKQGEDFTALAKQYSIDTGSKDQGGDVGLVNETTNFVPEFKKAALELQPNQLAPQPVKSEFGYHIIKAGEQIPVKQLSFAEVKEQLIIQLKTDRKYKMFEAYLTDLKNNADIQELR